MMQQINLYQQQFKPKQVALSPRTMLITIMLAVLVLATLSAYLHQKNKVMQTLIHQMAQQNITQNELSFETPLLDAQLHQLQQQHDDKQRLLDYLSQHSFGNRNGFSAMLEDLSRYRIDAVWLTDFSFTRGGELLTLKGYTFRSDLVPRYIDTLAQAKSFRDQQFTVFQLQQPDKKQNLYVFNLRTADDDNRQGEAQ